jgi:hypothetical protein
VSRWSSHRHLLATASLALLLTPGCGIPLASDEPPASNSCDANEECGPTGACVEGICVSTEADLGGLLIEVVIPPGSDYGAGTSSIIDLEARGGIPLQGSQAGGFITFADLVTDEVLEVTALMKLTEPPPECAALQDESSLPIVVEFYPDAGALGIPLPLYTAESIPGADQRVHMEVPAGDYDIQVRVAPPDDGEEPPSCDLPPYLFAGARVAGSGPLNINVTTTTPDVLQGSFSGFDVTGWTVDLLENDHGRVISTAAPVAEDGHFSLKYWYALIAADDPNALDAVVRLTPPEEGALQGMPVILWHLDSLLWSYGQDIALELGALAEPDAATIDIMGTVTDADLSPVPATVLIQSKALLGGAFGGNIAYKTTVSSDAEGMFSAALLPGEYTVIAIPSSSNSFAISSASWTILAGDLGGGKRIQVNPKSAIKGTVMTPSGEPVHDTPAFLQASAASTSSLLASLLDVSSLLPTSTTTSTDPSGVFQLSVDPGDFDLSLRPEEGTSLPWLARSKIEVKETEVPEVKDLGALVLTHPVLIRGQVRSPHNHVLGGSQLRAWLTLPPTGEPRGDDPMAGATAIQIGETTASADGSFTLYLPASIKGQ